MNSENNILRSCQETLSKGFRPGEYSWTREVKTVAVWFSLFILTAFVLLAFNPEQGLYANTNFHTFVQVINQIANGNPLFGLGVNWLVYGSTEFAANGHLLPATAISSFFSERYVPIVAFSIFSAEIFLSVYVSCRLFRFPVHVALIAAWLAALFYMPYVYPRLVVVELIIVVPFLSTASCMVILSVALFYRLGKSDPRNSLAISCGLFLIASYVTLTFLQHFVIYAYNIFWSCLGLFIFASSLRERAVKAVAGMVLATVYYVTFYDYLNAFYNYNWNGMIGGGEQSGLLLVKFTWETFITSFSSLDAFTYRFGWHFSNIYANSKFNNFSMYFLYASLASGFFYAGLFANRITSNLFQLAMTFLFAVFGQFLWLWGYHEAVIAPLYLISFVLGVLGAVTVLAHGLKHVLLSAGLPARLVNNGAMLVTGFRADDPKTPTGPVLTARGVVLIIMGAIFAFYYAYRIEVTPERFNIYVYGEKPDLEAFRILEREIGINRSPTFRGRLANLAVLNLPQFFKKDPTGKTIGYDKFSRHPAALAPKDPTGKTIGHDVFNDQLAADQEVAKKYGGDFKRTPAQKRIPTLFDVNRFTGPGIAVIGRYYLAEPNDLAYPQIFNISKFDKRLMEMLGVRFFMFHQPLPKQPGVTLRGTEIISRRLTLYLYELADPNVGNYSPTEQAVRSSAKEALDIIGNPTFDFRKSMLVRKRIPGTLVPAKASKVKIIGGRLDDEAESDGRSLIVLPFEYSHCLRVENKPGWTANPPELVRVNLDQIGLLFERDIKANIKFLFDPFNSECRHRDLQDWADMKIKELGVYKGVNIHGLFVK